MRQAQPTAVVVLYIGLVLLMVSVVGTFWFPVFKILWRLAFE